jgi:hypothetical protein
LAVGHLQAVDLVDYHHAEMMPEGVVSGLVDAQTNFVEAAMAHMVVAVATGYSAAGRTDATAVATPVLDAEDTHTLLKRH